MTELQQTYVDSSTPAARADLDKPAFDRLIMEKGRRVTHEIAVICPCKSRASAAQSSCMNCGGTGWVFMNPTETRMILSAMDVSTKIVPWSEEVRGMVQLSAMTEDDLSFMDRITALDALATYQQVVHLDQLDDNSLFAYLAYKPKEIKYIALFNSTTSKLQRLTEGVDFTIEGQALLLDNAYSGEDLSVTIRYKHAPAFHLVEMKRETMQSFKLEDGVEKLQHFPLSGYARRAHYVLDQQNLSGTRLLNNSFEVTTADAIVIKETTGKLFDFEDIVAGDTFDYLIRVVENDLAVDVTTRTYQMDVKDSTGSVSLQFTEGSGITKESPNILYLAKTSGQMSILPGIYSYALKETNGLIVETILRGKFIISNG